MNQELEAMLRCICASNPAGWSSQLSWVEYAHNSHTSSSTVPQFLRQARRIWSHTRAALQRTAERNRRIADRHRHPAPAYTQGQMVWLSSRDIKLRGYNRKFSPRFLGPFPMAEVLGPVSVQLDLPPSMKIHPVFHVSLLKPVVSSPLCPPVAPPPPVCLADGSLGYRMHRILDVRSRGRGRQFLVDWEGYGPEHREWIPGSWIEDISLIRDFEASRGSSSSASSSSAGPPGGIPWGWGGALSRCASICCEFGQPCVHRWAWHSSQLFGVPLIGASRI
uniref:Chromo domain-containing protein n=1 Tax=Nothobranchius furzeri TaxID=105023 RepID=A0A8C6NWT0_NOTFU